MTNHRKMNNAVVISIRPKWCELIADGKKIVEVRKTRPRLETPFKCYIYCTHGYYRTPKEREKSGDFWIGKPINKVSPGRYWGNGQVIGEFVCDKITGLRDMGVEEFCQKSCMTYEDWRSYTDGSKGAIYGWHISDMKIYAEPKKISSFYRYLPIGRRIYLKRPPQSWYYIAEREETT